MSKRPVNFISYKAKRSGDDEAAESPFLEGEEHIIPPLAQAMRDKLHRVALSRAEMNALDALPYRIAALEEIREAARTVQSAQRRGRKGKPQAQELFRTIEFYDLATGLYMIGDEGDPLTPYLDIDHFSKFWETIKDPLMLASFMDLVDREEELIISLADSKAPYLPHEKEVMESGLSALRAATPKEYLDFLLARLEVGGQIGSFNYRGFDKDDVLYAPHDVSLPPSYGEGTIFVIQPVNVKISFPCTQGEGHVFSMEAPAKAPSPHVVLFEDMIDPLLRKLGSFAPDHFDHRIGKNMIAHFLTLKPKKRKGPSKISKLSNFTKT